MERACSKDMTRRSKSGAMRRGSHGRALGRLAGRDRSWTDVKHFRVVYMQLRNWPSREGCGCAGRSYFLSAAMLACLWRGGLGTSLCPLLLPRLSADRRTAAALEVVVARTRGKFEKSACAAGARRESAKRPPAERRPPVPTPAPEPYVVLIGRAAPSGAAHAPFVPSRLPPRA